jgi:hypothetical protein
MRKLLLAGVLAGLGAALLVTPAFAFDDDFAVLLKWTSQHRGPHHTISLQGEAARSRESR